VDLTRHREVDRGDKVLTGAVVVNALSKRETLATVGDDYQHRAGHGGFRRNGVVGLADPDTVDGSGQLGTRISFEHPAKLVQRHFNSASQNSP
jgi:hypothetical protein